MTAHERPSEAIAAPPTPGELSEDQLAAIRLFELPDDKFEEALPKFVQERTASLSEGVSRSVISDDTTSFSSFIPPDRPLFPAEGLLDQQPFVLDDPRPYEAAVSRTRFEYKKLLHKLTPSKALLNAAVKGSFEVQLLYFGSHIGNEDLRLDRLEDGEESAVQGSTSVRVIGDSAMCMERAGIVHNSLLMLGLSSEFCIGGLKRLDSQGVKVGGEGHVFLNIKGSDGGDVLFDPANPKIIEYPDQGISELRPNVQALGTMPDTSFTVDRVRIVSTAGKVETIPDGTWTYYKNMPSSILGRMALL